MASELRRVVYRESDRIRESRIRKLAQAQWRRRVALSSDWLMADPRVGAGAEGSADPRSDWLMARSALKLAKNEPRLSGLLEAVEFEARVLHDDVLTNF